MVAPKRPAAARALARHRKNRLLHGTDAQLRQDWKRWVERLVPDLTAVFRHQQMFHELAEVVRNAPAAQRPPDFWRWMRNCYVADMCLRIRRLVDRDASTVSLQRLLEEIRQRPEAIDRESYRRLRRRQKASAWADHEFGGLVGPTKNALSPALVRKDTSLLGRTASPIVNFVNARIAHRGPAGQVRKALQAEQVDAAIDALDGVGMRYYQLLTGRGLISAETTATYDWRDVFTEPWLPKQRDQRPQRWRRQRPATDDARPR